MIREDIPAVELGVVAAALDPAVESISFAPAAATAAGPRHMFPGIHFWRLLFLFENADDPSYVVIGGHLDVVVADLDEPDLDDRLHMSLSELDFHEQADTVANLVADPAQLATVVGDAGFDDDPTRLIIVLDMFVDQSLRGRELGLVLIGEMHELLDDGHAMFIAPTTENTPPRLVAYWKKQLGAIDGDDGLLILPKAARPPSAADIIAKCQRTGYINVDAAGLRSRWENKDDTLFAVSDGREDLGNPDAELGGDFDSQAADAIEIALEASEYDSGIDIGIAAVLRFFAHNTHANAGYAEVFSDAADYLEAHPEVSVIATNWHMDPCPDGGTDLTLEIIVRGTP